MTIPRLTLRVGSTPWCVPILLGAFLTLPGCESEAEYYDRVIKETDRRRTRNFENGEKLKKADYALLGGRHKEAVEILDSLKHPVEGVHVARSFFMYAAAYRGLKEYDRSLSYASHLIGMNPKAPQGYTARGQTRWAMGNRDQALADLGKAVELGPKMPTPCRVRGLMLFEGKRYDLALKDFERVVELSPNLSADHHAKALCADKLGRKAEAIEGYEKYIELSGSTGDKRRIEAAKLRLKQLKE